MFTQRAMISIVVFGACSGTEAWSPIDPPPTALVETVGCGDVVMSAGDEDATQSLRLSLPAVIDAARASGAPHRVFTFSVEDTEVSVRLVTGQRIQSACEDLLDPDTVVEATFTARSGQVTVMVEPLAPEEPWLNPARATAELLDVLLEDELGNTVELEAFVFSELFVGWWPG